MKLVKSSLWFALIAGTVWFALCVLATCLDLRHGFNALLLNALLTADLMTWLMAKLPEAKLSHYLGNEVEVVGLLLASWSGALIWFNLAYYLWHGLLWRYGKKVLGAVPAIALRLFPNLLTRRV